MDWLREREGRWVGGEQSGEKGESIEDRGEDGEKGGNRVGRKVGMEETGEEGEREVNRVGRQVRVVKTGVRRV